MDVIQVAINRSPNKVTILLIAFQLLVDAALGSEEPSILQHFIESYQVIFFTVFLLLAVTAIVIIGECS